MRYKFFSSVPLVALALALQSLAPVYAAVLGPTAAAGAGPFTAPTTPIGLAAAQTPVTFNITASGTLPALSNGNVLTQGAPGKDFSLGAGSTCTGPVIIGNNCTVNVVFTPAAPGSRLGAVNLKDSSGNVLATAYISGIGTGPLATVTPGRLYTVAGDGTQCTSPATGCGDGALSTAAGSHLNSPQAVAFDGSDNYYIADEADYRIRKVDTSNGALSTVAGNGTACSPATAACGDGSSATAASLAGPYGVAVDGAGNILIADTLAHRVRRVSAASGTITTIAGNGTQCSLPTAPCGDGGAAIAANLNSPYGVAVDGAGDVYIADTYDQRIRKVSAAGTITTVAGSGTVCASSSSPCGDGSSATASAAAFNLPVSVAIDSNGNLYILDQADYRVRKVTSTSGALSTVAGNGISCSSYTSSCGDNGAATSANLNQAYGVAVDSVANLYIADSGDMRVRFVNATSGLITTIAGSAGLPPCTTIGAACGDGGAAILGQLYLPYGVALDDVGNILIADRQDARVRKVTGKPGPLAFPNTAVNTTSSTSQTVTVNNIGNAPLKFPRPATGQNASLSQFFMLSNSSTCPEVNSSSSSAGFIPAGGNCTEVIYFTPEIPGAVTGDLVIATDSLYVGGTPSTVVLTGDTAPSLTLTVPDESAASGSTAVTIEALVGYGGNTKPTGALTFTVAGSSANIGPVSCMGKNGHLNCTATYNASSLLPGTYYIVATQTPDSVYTTQVQAYGKLTITSTHSGPVRPVAVRSTEIQQ